MVILLRFLSSALILAQASCLRQSTHFSKLVNLLLRSASAIAAFKPYSFYASAAYCKPSVTLTWTCGSNCDANSHFQPFWYVGYDPSLKAVIVGHQGTDTSKLLPLITDASIFLKKLDISFSLVHEGFGSLKQILAAVESAMSTHSTSTVTVVGHSLGGGIALIGGVYLDLQLPSANVSVVTYGMPRVGNQEFADYVDAHLSVSHKKHILDSGAWVACPGQDNTDSQCTTGDVKSLFEGDADDHDGPYDGVNMGC
ncbi:alpha/beta-hydrolase [Hymenopellis radicata]|nr:alpha/beta-hydrolase [Hymenopellis radicata]